jgi:Predicted secreted protein containing a PDZ domain
VIERRASEFERLFPWVHSDATLVPANLIVPPGTSGAAARAADLREMQTSQRVAAAVALRRLGYHVIVHPNGVIVNAVDLGTAAYRELQPADVIIGIDGKPTPTIDSLRRILAPVNPGDTVQVKVRRGSKVLTKSLRTVNDPQQPGHALIGFEPDQAAQIKLPLKVSIDAQGIGGPSAGLAFALEVMQQLGRNVDRGHLVAATGEMELNGVVAPIGGVKQKVFDARKAKVDVFLVPAGDNAASRDAMPGRSASSPSARSARRCKPWQRCRRPARNPLSETGGNSSVFVRDNACFGSSGTYHRTSRAAGSS